MNTKDAVTATIMNTMNSHSTIDVALGDRSYEIRIGEGLLAEAGAHLAPLLGEHAARRHVTIVTDANVAALHLDTLTRALDAAKITHRAIVLDPGEHTKDFTHLAKLLDDWLDLGIERRSMIVALGGGVVGDLTGFAAAIALRGIDFVQMPTTLLSQVDSSVGGKTGINTRHGKNLVGAFYQPRLVLADIDVLDTLPPRELRAGYAEVVKYGIIRDPGFFAWLEKHGPALIAGDHAARTEAVAISCQAKADVVSADEREQGERALLNLGHTFGHAMEAESGFSAPPQPRAARDAREHRSSRLVSREFASSQTGPRPGAPQGCRQRRRGSSQRTRCRRIAPAAMDRHGRGAARPPAGAWRWLPARHGASRPR